MKKRLFFLLSIAAMAAMFVNLQVSHPMKSAKNFNVANIRILQASAGEMYCDATNTRDCKITANGQTGTGTGQLVSKP